ncbi:endo-1,4-beta-xylanase [Chroococcidiopsis sp. TS-821]|uniref:endo-1,4-beta-xylanase n=1 Tax=Chroococcidiopsis sp. TS-821 TaxID=1378066 RepID=UPI000CEEFD16|nr:endo-1,4-beta-xylanase [Chroococcidiopsis sp. TS-821]
MHKQLLLKRRHFLMGLGALTGMGACTTASRIRHFNQFVPEISADPSVTLAAEAIALRTSARTKGLLFGAAVNYNHLSTDRAYADLVAQQCAILVPALELKWQVLRPSPSQFNFTRADWMAQFARRNGMLFRGHTLVWHKALPDWFANTVNKRNAEKILIEHISRVAGHYAGRMHSWDVVNEAIEPRGQRGDMLRNTPWLRFLGPDYIELAFRAAAEADPRAILMYNDFGIEHDTPQAETKRTATLRLLERLKSRGVPIQGLGVQGHLFGHPDGVTFRQIGRFLRNVADLGLDIMITELDVNDQQLPKEPERRDRAVAKIYADFLEVVLAQPAVTAVITWGISDRYTWLASRKPREDGARLRPLPFDAQLQPKLAWQALAGAIAQAPTRPSLPGLPTPPTTFADIQGHWAQRYIQALADKNIISGFPDGTFKPNAPVTRAEFAAIVTKAFPQASQNNPSIEFVDVPRSFWGYSAIQTAVRRGFLAGYPGRIFQPSQQIPRVQVIVALASGLNLSSDNTSVLSYYQDAAEIPTYAANKVAAATQRQMVVNYPTVRQLNPNRNATRAEVAAFVYQALVDANQAQFISSPYLVRV